MIKSILLPLKFILYFIVSVAVFCLFALIYNWGLRVSPSAEIQKALFLYLPEAAGNVIYPSVSAALLFTVFDLGRKRLNIVSVVILSAFVFLILFFGPQFSSSLDSGQRETAYQPFLPERIHLTEGSLIYTDNVGGTRPEDISGIVIRDRGSGMPGLRYYETGKISGSDDRIFLKLDDGRELDVVPENPVFHEIFNPSQILSVYLGDIGFFSMTLTDAAENGGKRYLLLVTAFSAFLMICLLFRGISVWPLFDMTLILFLHRLVVYVFHLFSTESEFISETIFGGKFSADIPLFTLFILSAVLLISGVLFKTTKSMRKT